MPDSYFTKIKSQKQRMEDGNALQKSIEWLQDHETKSLTLEGLQIVKAHHGFLLCNFIIPVSLADKDGNWEVGAMAALIDAVGATAVYSFAGHIKASVEVNISFYSTAKIQEEVQIEAKVIGHRERLTSVQVEIRRKVNEDLIALSRQWMASKNMNSTRLSKL